MNARPECADGCPLTDPAGCQDGCIRTARTVPAGVCECGRGPVHEVADGTYPVCAECRDEAIAAGADITRPPEPAGQQQMSAPEHSMSGHVGTDTPKPPAPEPVPQRTPLPPDAEGTTIVVTPEVPFRWGGYIALAVVLAAAILCAMVGWTR